MSAARLAAHDTATIHEAQGRRGALPSSVKPVHPSARLCGPAFTVDCPPGDNLWIHRGSTRPRRAMCSWSTCAA